MWRNIYSDDEWFCVCVSVGGGANPLQAPIFTAWLQLTDSTSAMRKPRVSPRLRGCSECEELRHLAMQRMSWCCWLTDASMTSYSQLGVSDGMPTMMIMMMMMPTMTMTMTMTMMMMMMMMMIVGNCDQHCAFCQSRLFAKKNWSPPSWDIPNENGEWRELIVVIGLLSRHVQLWHNLVGATLGR